MNKKISVWLEAFALDLRSLAIFRIAFGSCLFIDVFYRLFYIRDFYSDDGVLPREAMIRLFISRWEHSFFLASGQTEVIFGLIVLLLVFIAMFIVGFHTRLVAFLTWILMTSMHTRAQIILHGGDDVIRVMLFWCQFVPLGAMLSVDRALSGDSKIAPSSSSYRLLSFGGAGLMLQLIAMYLFTAALKWHPSWHTNGDAIYFALSLEQFTSYLGHWLLNFPKMLQWMTYGTLVFEFVAPAIVILPVVHRYVRTTVVFLFIGFHFGLFLCLHLGMFPWVCISAWLMFLPGRFWDKNQFNSQSVVFQLQKRIDSLAQWLKSVKAKTPTHATRYSRWQEGIAALFIILVFLWNVSHHESFPYEKTKEFRTIMNITSMFQKWSMFAPYPRKDDGWYVIEANLFNGTKVNPMAKDHVWTEEKPEDVAGTYINSMWRKYLTNSWLKTNHAYRLFFGRYLCRMWNSTHSNHEEQIDTMKIFFMLEMNSPQGEPVQPLKKEILWRHYCFEKPADWDS